MVRRIAGVLMVLLVIAGAVAVGYGVRVATEPEEAPPSTIATATAQVVRTDLVQTETLSGTLGFADRESVRTGLSGTITALPDEAERLERGDVAFEVDGLPVIVFYGERPAWRTLADDVDDGSDVQQLEENLAELGFGPEDWEPDTEYTQTTARAVEDWREEVGLPDGDEVEYGRVLFLPADVRVGATLAEIGQQIGPGTPVYEVTAFEQEVLIDLDPDDVDLVAVGDPVEVVLPDDRRVSASIAEVGRVVQPSGNEPGAEGVIEVVVELPEPVLDLDQAPVDIEVESDRASNVLAVPVRALIALSDGGYAVEIEGRLVGVETGEFAGGLVEVTGALEEGDTVVVPQ